MSFVMLKAEACPLRSARITSKPLIVAYAVFSVLKPLTWPDQLLQLAVVSLNNVVQVIDLSVQRPLWTFALAFQLGESGGVVGALSVLMTVGFSQSFKLLSALPRKRFAADVLRVGER